MAQFILEIVVFACILIASISLLIFLQREKFLQAHVYLSCLLIWILLTLFSIIPIVLQEYISIIRLIGIITFAIITIHTTLPISRCWTALMASCTSFFHLIFILRTHQKRLLDNRMNNMEFKLEVKPKNKNVKCFFLF